MLIHCVEAVSRRLKRMLVIAAVLGAYALGDSVRADQITYEMVPVGNPGNASDPATGSQYGAVGYTYQIGKYDVTIRQYTDFLNAVAKTDTYNLYKLEMGTDPNIRGISRVGESGTYTYSVFGSSGNNPITWVSWFDAARFANWMTNGQGSGSTETGAYTLNGATTGDAVAANPGAAFRLPTVSEWYKAAYFSPNYGGVGVPGYYMYATQSDSIPGNVVGGSPNQVNSYYYGSTGYSVTQSTDYDPNQNYLTDVGAFTASASYYGTFDQSGNVYQYNDLNGMGGPIVGRRGGAWNPDSYISLSAYSTDIQTPPTSYGGNTGFRLASSVPEIDPAGMGSVLALVTGALGLIERRRLKAQRA